MCERDRRCNARCACPCHGFFGTPYTANHDNGGWVAAVDFGLWELEFDGGAA